MIPEQELLDLLDKTEQEQIRYFDYAEVLRMKYGYGHTESLPDLAERLWKRARETGGCDLLQSLCDVAAVIEKRVVCDKCGHEGYTGKSFFWATDADAIHRIVAAILALQRAGVDVKESVE